MACSRCFLWGLLLLPGISFSQPWLAYEGHGENAEFHIVLLSGDQEYRSEEALPQLARILSTSHGFRTTVLFTQHADAPGIVNPMPPVEVPGLHHLNGAHLMVIFTRFIALPDEQMQFIDDFLRAGKPVIGIRTATHAFAFRQDASDSPWRHYGNGYEGEEFAAWRGGFGRLVLGEQWIAHHGEHKQQSTRGIVAPGAYEHPVRTGIGDGDIWGSTDVYRVRLPLPGDAQPIILGEVIERTGEFDAEDLHFGMRDTDRTPAVANADGVTVNDPLMPIAWTKSYQLPDGRPGRAFVSTIGSSGDMLSEGVRRLWVNAAYWALGLDVPAQADVDIVGTFAPTQYGFHTPEYWSSRRLATADHHSPQPNIVLILADDLGYGDIGSYNPHSQVQTPRMDRLAEEGMRFTDAHSPSAVCSPTRYALLTGRYAWRTRLKSGVLWGYSPLLIDPERATLPSLLQSAGYYTAAIGKWHLGFTNNEPHFYERPDEQQGGLGTGSRISPGPNEVGFDYFFGIPASLDMKPYLYIENGRPVHPLTGRLVEASRNRRSGGSGLWRTGEIAEGFDHQSVLPTLTERAVDRIAELAADGAERPFFLYLALTAPHTPWLADPQYQGASGAGHYGDFVAHVDGVVGQVIDALAHAGVEDQTIVIVSSDNGAHWTDSDKEAFDHLANGSWRGQKGDIHEGGHRVPLIIRWPGNVPENTTNDHLVSLMDLGPTLISLLGLDLPDDAAVDSADFSATLLGRHDEQAPRPALINHSFHGLFAIREGPWKLIEGLGSGGFTPPQHVDPEAGGPAVQLYNLERDPGETLNLASEEPEIVARLLESLEAIRDGD